MIEYICRLCADWFNSADDNICPWCGGEGIEIGSVEADEEDEF